MIKIIAGTIFGAFFVAPVLASTATKIDTTGIQEVFYDLGKEVLQIGLQMITSVL